MDLIRKLIEVDPLKRLSAEEALKHAWFENKLLPKVPNLNKLVASA
jgi:serine/threonine protein kinase